MPLFQRQIEFWMVSSETGSQMGNKKVVVVRAFLPLPFLSTDQHNRIMGPKLNNCGCYFLYPSF